MVSSRKIFHVSSPLFIINLYKFGLYWSFLYKFTSWEFKGIESYINPIGTHNMDSIFITSINRTAAVVIAVPNLPLNRYNLHLITIFFVQSIVTNCLNIPYMIIYLNDVYNFISTPYRVSYFEKFLKNNWSISFIDLESELCHKYPDV